MYKINAIIQMKFRKEFDSIGKINVPNDKYWGASTERSKNFLILENYMFKNINKIYCNYKKSCSNSS